MNIVFFGSKMKYIIKGSTITIKYINNGKVKTMKLNINDKTDLDFFNKLQQAPPNKQDSMCELYQRNILKPIKKNVEHLTPLTLIKEIERPKIVKQQELEQRKRELEQDKKDIEKEAESLLQEGVELKNLKENEDLTDKVKVDVNHERVKNIIRKYREIERIETMVINELNSMEIKSANTVTISELKNLTVNAYENINKTILETKLNNEDKQTLANTIVDMIRPNITKLKESLSTNISKVVKILKSKPNIDDVKKIVTELKNTLLNELNTLPQDDNVVEDIENDLNNIQNNDNTEIVINTLKTIEEKLDKLPNVFNDKTITKNELTLNELLEQFERNTDFFDQNVSGNILNTFKSNIPIIDNLPQDPREFASKIVINWSKTMGKKESTKNSTLKSTIKHFMFIYNNSIYSTETIGIYQDIEPIECYIPDDNNFTITESKPEQILWELYQYKIDELKTIYLKDIPKYIHINEPYNKIIISTKPPLYLRYQNSDKANDSYANATIYTKYLKYIEAPKNDTKIIQILLDGQIKEIMKNNSEESEGLYSGKLDLDNATLDEKLNEIIQILSRMNYNIFTTTSMYKESRNKYSKEANTKKTNKNPYTSSKSKGIDLDLLSELGLD